jgi:curved DNA-binding protein CbpA
MAKRDPYADLGVGRTATPADIKSAFRKKAKQTHPDAGAKEDDAFQRISESYRLLMSPERKAKFDATGEFDDKPGNSAALQIISNMMAEIMARASGLEGCDTDVVEAMRNTLDEKVEDFRQKIVQLERKRKNLDRFAKRFKRKSGGNLLRNMVEASVRSIDAQIAGGHRAIADMEAAKALLKGYSFEADERPAPPVWINMQMFSGSGTTSA